VRESAHSVWHRSLGVCCGSGGEDRGASKGFADVPACSECAVPRATRACAPSSRAAWGPPSWLPCSQRNVPNLNPTPWVLQTWTSRPRPSTREGETAAATAREREARGELAVVIANLVP